MQKWEYSKAKDLSLADLNNYGNDGWELISVSSDVSITVTMMGGGGATTLWYTFKRPKP